MTVRGLKTIRPKHLAYIAGCSAGIAGISCGFEQAPAPADADGTGTNTLPNGTGGVIGMGTGGGDTAGPAGGGMTGVVPGGGGAAGDGTVPAGGGTPGAGGGATQPGPATTFLNYELTGSWPELGAAIPTMPGSLSYIKQEIHSRFLGESCAIADYNQDGNPDVSSGRRWWEGPDFTVEHIFRGGHDDLPRNGDEAELVDGVSDDWADYPWDVNGDGWTDIINIASSDADTPVMPNPRPQTSATAVWYENPGPGLAGDPEWLGHTIHSDVRHEQHGLVDVNGDGNPEIFGACRGCDPIERKGFYQLADWTNPMGSWDFHFASAQVEFPFGGTGWMHGLGAGDVNGDGRPDLLDRVGIWLQQPDGSFNDTPCQGAEPCGWIQTQLWDGNTDGNRGGAHMYAYDVDGDGDQDIFSADWAHGWGLAWYEQTPGLQFVKHQFMGDNSPGDTAMYGIEGFSEPHAAQAVDMDGDGVRDIVTGKMRYAHPRGYGDPDLEGIPYVYVFRTVQDAPGTSGAAHMEPYMVDDVVGVGRQLSVGHVNTDGIVDICIASKLGMYLFLGQP